MLGSQREQRVIDAVVGENDNGRSALRLCVKIQDAAARTRRRAPA